MGFFDEDRLAVLCEALEVPFDGADRRATSQRVLDKANPKRATAEMSDAEIEAWAEIDGWMYALGEFSHLMTHAKLAARSKRGKA